MISREALVARWLHANPKHSVASLDSHAPVGAPAPNLQALVQHELATGHYRLNEFVAPPPPESWWEQVLDWIRDRWDDLWKALSARVHVSPAGASAIGDVILVVVAVVLVLVALRLFYGLQISRAAKRAAAQPLEPPPDPDALFRQACDAASRGEYGAAALLLFAATIALLDGRAIDVERSSTVGDLRRKLRGTDASLVKPFDEIATPFVRKAYAERAVDEPQWQRARQAFGLLLQRAQA